MPLIALVLTLLMGATWTAAFAGSATSSVAATKGAALHIIVTGIYVDCSWSAGQKVLTLGVTGGDGNPITYTLGGTPTGDLAISGNTLVVGSNGVTAANCNTVESLTINAAQP